jgi:hypothetical protein
MNARRLRRVALSEQFIANILSTGLIWDGRLEVIGGVPRDAEFVRFFYDPQTPTLWAVFTHPSFDAIPEGHIIPAVSITYQFTPYPPPPSA